MKTIDPMSFTPENPTLRRHYMKLQSLRITLLGNGDGQSADRADALTCYDGNMTNMGSHGFVPVPSLGSLSMEQNALAEINAACQRIHNGTFGICEITGKPISESRLRVAPWTRYGAEVTERLKLRHLADAHDSQMA